MKNADKMILSAINDFKDYLRELSTGTTFPRYVEIRNEAVACADLMNYSPDLLWDREDFRKLDSLVGQTMMRTANLMNNDTESSLIRMRL